MAKSEKRGSLEKIDVSASLTQSGVKLSVRTRFLTAIDRFAGSFFDRRTAQNQGKEAIIDVESETALAIAKMRGAAEIELERRRLTAILAREEAKQINREEIAMIAFEEIRGNASESNTEADNSIEGEIEDDWFDTFGRLAENATTERMRVMWGRVLAGEIRKPGAFSLATLQFLSTLDKQIADTFQKHLLQCWGLPLIPRHERISGELLEELTLLEELGLLLGVTGTINHELSTAPKGEGWIYYTTTPVEKRAAVLRYKTHVTKPHIDFPSVRITRTGWEIANLIGRRSQAEELRTLAKHLEQFMTDIELLHSKWDGTNLKIVGKETLYRRPNPQQSQE